jgi:hypothetical protein
MSVSEPSTICSHVLRRVTSTIPAVIALLALLALLWLEGP